MDSDVVRDTLNVCLMHPTYSSPCQTPLCHAASSASSRITRGVEVCPELHELQAPCAPQVPTLCLDLF